MEIKVCDWCGQHEYEMSLHPVDGDRNLFCSYSCLLEFAQENAEAEEAERD